MKNLISLMMFGMAMVSLSLPDERENHPERIDERIHQCMQALAGTLHEIRDKSTAREQESRLNHLYSRLDALQRELLRPECPRDPQVAEICSKKLQMACLNEEYMREIERLRREKFYGLRLYREHPEGADILRPLTCYTDKWGLVAQELAALPKAELAQVKKYQKEIKRMHDIEDALRRLGQDSDLEILDKISSLSSDLHLDVRDELHERSKKSGRNDLIYYFQKFNQAWIDLHDQYVMLYQAKHLNQESINKATENLSKLSHSYIDEYYNDYDGYMELRAQLLRIKQKRHFYNSDIARSLKWHADIFQWEFETQNL